MAKPHSCKLPYSTRLRLKGSREQMAQKYRDKAGVTEMLVERVAVHVVCRIKYASCSI